MSGVTRTALVTGGAGGLGHALTAHLIDDDWRVVVIDRTEHGGDNLLHIACDLSDPDGLQNAMPAILAAGPYDLVIHNAGQSATGAFADIPTSAYLRLVQVNCVSPIALTAALLREAAITRHGALVFISSLSHYTGYPGAAVYAGTKDALSAYARSIRPACAAASISVSVAYPGPLRTSHAERHAPQGAAAEKRMMPEEAAHAILEAVDKGRRTVIPGRANRFYALTGRLFPATITHVMRRIIFDKLPGARW